uniref:leucine rich adaptor protein 1-like n=1 Tax=Euleptes europaea TaxID=460621 RepID=UPI0025419200|nr:leucine rich adaptor protein 1-like [Euleptes europaea]XP_056722644.1 leucine rich adaptor protein 1-like [Euleptes europaea]
MEDRRLPDLHHVELKLGRKVPESLVRCLRGEEPEAGRAEKDGGERPSGGPGPAPAGFPTSSAPRAPIVLRGNSSSAIERLETKLHLLHQEMVDLRATDIKLMRQLLVINESIESIKWMMEEKGAIPSRGSSLSGSFCSLLESQETSLRGSYNSLQDSSDGLDGISVGSYLDTLADDIPGRHTPSDMDQFSDSSFIDDSQSLHKYPKLESDEYYCFG